MDAVIDNAYGRYHDMLINQSACGPGHHAVAGLPANN